MLTRRVRAEGVGVLFAGSLATCAAAAAGHYPWFLTYNALSAGLPAAQSLGDLDLRLLDLLRAAAIGLAASCASDVCSNSLRCCRSASSVGLIY